MLPNIGITELIVILVIVVILFGATRLPQVGEGIGKAIKNFKKAISDSDDKNNTKDAKKS